MCLYIYMHIHPDVYVCVCSYVHMSVSVIIGNREAYTLGPMRASLFRDIAAHALARTLTSDPIAGKSPLSYARAPAPPLCGLPCGSCSA